MLVFAYYLLKVIVCSGILYGYYWLMLRNKIFHQYNRFYILAAVILTLVLPAVQINVWHNINQPAPNGIKLLQVVNNREYLDEMIHSASQIHVTTEQVLLYVYSITSLFFLSLFVLALIRIRRIFINHQHSLIGNIFFVNTTAKGTPFSFLSYIFWNDHIDLNSTTGNQVFKHELAHVQQKHSYDKIFMNVTLIFFWCNPFFWLMRKELNMIHEFVADKIAVEDSDTEAFAAMILHAAFPRHRIDLSNTFFFSPIKRRLMMLTKNRNLQTGYISRLLVLPLIVLIFVAFTLKAKTFKNNNHNYDGKLLTVVIDAGHGGSDLGGTNLQGNVFEKDVNLAITRKIKSLNSNNKIRIILTRETDVYQTPMEKVALTKVADPDLFISIHMAADNSYNDNLKSGLNVWVANNSINTGSSQMLASALLNEFGSDYKLQVNKHPQQSKTTIRVLQDASCTAVLVEAGNINNEKDLDYLQTEAAKEMFARKILDAVEKYAFAKEKGQTGRNTPAIAITENISNKKNDTIPEITLKNPEKALIIIDGKLSTQTEFKKILPENIARVDVIKNEEGKGPYSNKGKNGVIIITTKTKKIVPGDTKVEVKTETSIREAKPLVNGDITIRLTDTLHPHLQPLYVIDGTVQNAGFAISSVVTDNIESINVIKDKTGLDKYGERAINGVIEITMKSKALKEITIPNN